MFADVKHWKCEKYVRKQKKQRNPGPVYCIYLSTQSLKASEVGLCTKTVSNWKKFENIKPEKLKWTERRNIFLSFNIDSTTCKMWNFSLHCWC